MGRREGENGKTYPPNDRGITYQPVTPTASPLNRRGKP